MDLAGGVQHAEHVLKPLETLCANEESTVREKALESVKKILNGMRLRDFEPELIGFI